jgi:hypothetical protein
MSMSQVQSLLLYSLAINYVFLLLWFAAFTCAHEALYKLHSRWFKLTTSTFDALHYGAMAAYKIAIILFNLTPLLALWLSSAD